MKSERLLSIMILLANRRQVSAPELAERYGVSVRTIYRDVAALSASGVPVVTETGRGGGISLIEDYKIDRTVVKPSELGHVVSGLQGLATVLPDPAIQESLEKFRNLVPRAPDERALAVPKPLELHLELSPSRRESRSIATIRQAASLGRLVRLDYSDGSGRLTSRQVEPYALVFQWSSWFLYAWCRLRGAWRLFKLSRIRGVEQLGERFASRRPDLESRPWTKDWDSEPPVPAVLRFLPHARQAALEHFEPEQIEELADGSVLVRSRFPLNDWTTSWLAGFGGALEVLEPATIRNRLRAHAEAILACCATAGSF
jgi:predicted DNA-binding transcriptional regulator YafY